MGCWGPTVTELTAIEARDVFTNNPFLIGEGKKVVLS